MKPTIKHIEGTHLTAADKRNIIDCIEYLRTQDNHAQWLGRKGSKKHYCITPDPSRANTYLVLIREAYTNDYGRKLDHTTRHAVVTRNVEPLPHANWSIAQADLFSEKPEAAA